MELNSYFSTTPVSVLYFVFQRDFSCTKKQIYLRAHVWVRDRIGLIESLCVVGQ